jgi:hypothetical protein
VTHIEDAPSPLNIFPDLQSLDDIVLFVADGYGYATGTPAARRGSAGGPLPVAVSLPGVLLARAVEIAPGDGLTMQDLWRVFARLGKERGEQGLKEMRGSGFASKTRESRPKKNGRTQRQVVFRPAAVSTETGP